MGYTKEYLKKDPNNWKWLICFYTIALVVCLILSIQF